ncbi:MAG: nucleoside-diphosphate kinase [Chloroflexi bacterium]|nr:nucleoside-diphosphate kinase [Chloroflexota bacterium]MCY3936918.1 nucleoside-diphosphate kinase [Chloroflexota bacterium]
MEQTFVLLKPDAVQRGLAGEILARFERRGYRVVALKMLQADRELAERHYEVHKGKFFFEGLVQHLTSGPVVAMILEGENVIQAVRTMVGSTIPNQAAAGTIRGDLAVAGLRNLVHASDAPESAEHEMSLYFEDVEVLEYQRDLDRWVFES